MKMKPSAITAKIKHRETVMNIPTRLRTVTTQVIALLSLLITMTGGTLKAADEIVFFHVNALGSATAAFNENGDVCWKQQYTPYGEQTNNDDASPPDGCGLIGKDRGFTGHTQDESGLTYMQQRYYDPSIGRFLSIDPVGVIAEAPATYNRYMYANNNPYKFIDPDGHAVVSVTGNIQFPAILVYAIENVFDKDVPVSGFRIGIAGSFPTIFDDGVSFDLGAFAGVDIPIGGAGIGKASLDLGLDNGGLNDLEGGGLEASAIVGRASAGISLKEDLSFSGVKAGVGASPGSLIQSIAALAEYLPKGGFRELGRHFLRNNYSVVATETRVFSFSDYFENRDNVE